MADTEAHDAHEERGRGHGHRPHVQGGLPQGAALARARRRGRALPLERKALTKALSGAVLRALRGSSSHAFRQGFTLDELHEAHGGGRDSSSAELADIVELRSRGGVAPRRRSTRVPPAPSSSATASPTGVSASSRARANARSAPSVLRTASCRCSRRWIPAPGNSRPDAVLLLDLRGRNEVLPGERERDRHPGRRAQPHRPGDRVRLLLRPRSLDHPREGYEAIMVNCNPETVSTDYDTSDRLYFEPLTVEDVAQHVRRRAAQRRDRPVRRPDAAEASRALERRRPILGHLARTRSIWPRTASRFGKLLDELGITQPDNGAGPARRRRRRSADRIGYPVLVRPSRARRARMKIVYEERRLGRYIDTAMSAPRTADPGRQVPRGRGRGRRRRPVRRRRRCTSAAIMEHVEEAGIHSGDSPASSRRSLWPRACSSRCAARPTRWPGAGRRGPDEHPVRRTSKTAVRARGQPAASRTVPFVSKATGVPIAKLRRQDDAGPRWPSSASPHSRCPTTSASKRRCALPAISRR